MTPEIETMYFRNPDQEKLIRGLVTVEAHLIPYWVRRLKIRSQCPDEDFPNTLLSVAMSFAYHSASINVFPAFFDVPPGEQRQTVRHEIVHLHTERLTDWMRDVILPFVKRENPELASTYRMELKDRMEHCVESIAVLLDMGREGREHNADIAATIRAGILDTPLPTSLGRKQEKIPRELSANPVAPSPVPVECKDPECPQTPVELADCEQNGPPPNGPCCPGTPEAKEPDQKPELPMGIMAAPIPVPYQLLCPVPGCEKLMTQLYFGNKDRSWWDIKDGKLHGKFECQACGCKYEGPV